MIFLRFLYFLVLFLAIPSVASILFWIVTVGLVVVFILRKKLFGELKWIWVSVFFLEAIALFNAFWDYMEYRHAPKIDGAIGIVVISIQIIVTVIMCISFRKRIAQPKKKPKPDFCGDI